MDQFAPYVDQLQALVIASAARSASAADIAAALDGQPSQMARQLIDLDALRNAGAFFTGSKLAQWALAPLQDQLSFDSRIVDPTCGVGDLLLQCARYLPTKRSVASTIDAWGAVLSGCDIAKPFVRAARLRLALMALEQCNPKDRNWLPPMTSLFPSIRSHSALRNSSIYKEATHIVINPPFTYIAASEQCRWGGGRINAAAYFVEDAICNASPGTRLIAILPEVLRSGSRYDEWRRLIESSCRANSIRTYGRFDRDVEMEVFVLDCTVQQAGTHGRRWKWARPQPTNHTVLGDLCTVLVGSVVPHRHGSRKGPWVPYICVHDVPPWTTVRDVKTRRRFAGSVFTPPFVVVRRTSRADDQRRAVATIVRGKRPVAVENHLLVLRPNDGTLRSCRRLVEILARPQTDSWLNNRIRCRHLTVEALSAIPFWEECS